MPQTPEIIALAERVRAAIRTAKALGIWDEVKDLDAEQMFEAIRKRQELQGTRHDLKMRQWKIERRKYAAAYITGVSLGQLGQLIGSKSPSVNARIKDEIPLVMREQLSQLRTGRNNGRYRLRTISEATFMLQCVSDQEALDIPSPQLATLMAQRVEHMEEDETDPYLRLSAGVETSRILQEPQRREGDGGNQNPPAGE